MTDPSAIRQALTDHLTLCQQVLELVERESLALRAAEAGTQFGVYQEKKALLARLETSVDSLRVRRQEWLALPAPQRRQHRDLEALLRQNQDLVMKIIVLDRENEQHLLRRGLVPSRHLPSPHRQRPHFVADLYRRQSGAGQSPAAEVLLGAEPGV